MLLSIAFGFGLCHVVLVSQMHCVRPVHIMLATLEMLDQAMHPVKAITLDAFGALLHGTQVLRA